MICTECGNDDATEGHEWCMDCLEANPWQYAPSAQQCRRNRPD